MIKKPKPYITNDAVISNDQNCESFFSSGKNTILKNESNVFQFQHTYTSGIGYNVVSKYELNNNVLSGRIISEGGSAYFVYRLSDEPNPCE